MSFCEDCLEFSLSPSLQWAEVVERAAFVGRRRTEYAKLRARRTLSRVPETFCFGHITL
jgi:hypothetical protein